MTAQRELELGEREIARDTIARVDAMPAPVPARTGICPLTPTCAERGWAEQHEPPFEERLEKLFAKPRVVGEDDNT